jgi:uncharacterized protein YkwD
LRPFSTRADTLVRRLVAPLLAALACTVPAVATAAPRDPSTAAMLAELNRVRAEADLAPLHLDARMARNARSYARTMARSGEIGHGAWDRRVARSSGNSTPVGEVIGWLARDAARREAAWLVRSWLASATHRPVLLDDAFRRVGVGRALGTVRGALTAIYTLDFAAPRQR